MNTIMVNLNNSLFRYTVISPPANFTVDFRRRKSVYCFRNERPCLDS